MDGDGQNPRRVTVNLDFNDVGPDVNRDGTKVTFFSDRDGDFEIYEMKYDKNRVSSSFTFPYERLKA